MSISRGQDMAQSDMDALSTLANTKLSPGTPYVFASNSFSVYAPSNLTLTGSGSGGGDYPHVIRIYSYKTVAGVKQYSANYLQKTFNVISYSTFGFSWTDSGTGEDGYLVVNFYNPTTDPGGTTEWNFRYQYITGATSFTYSNAFPPWILTQDVPGYPYQPENNWLATMHQIRWDIFKQTELNTTSGSPGVATKTPDDSWRVSGPYCVGINSLLLDSYRYSGVTPYMGGSTGPFNFVTRAYKSVEFWYSPTVDPYGMTLATGIQMGGQGAVPPTTDVSSYQDTGSNSVVLNIVCDQTVTTNIYFQWTIVWDGIGPFIPAGNTDTPSTGGTWSWNLLSGSTYAVTLHINGSLTAGTYSYTIALVNTSHFSGVTNAFVSGFVTLATATTAASVSGINPVFDLKKIAASASSSTTTVQTVGGSTTVNYPRAYSMTAGPSDFYPTGVWVANTLPVPYLNTLVQMNLPQYQSGTNQVSAMQQSEYGLAGINQISHSAGWGASALWPIYRDTQFNFTNYFPNPYFFSDPYHVFQNLGQISIAPGQTYSNAYLIPSNPYTWKLWQNTGTLPVYVSKTDIPIPGSPGTYDFVVNPGGYVDLRTQVGTPDIPSTWCSNQLYYTIWNNTGTIVEFDLQTALFTTTGTGPTDSYFGDTPQFWPLTAYQFYSYLDNPGTWSISALGVASQLPVQTIGHCVFDLTIRRSPVANANGILETPSVGTSNLDVKIGCQLGATWNNSGTFTLLQDFTIPSGSAELHTQVFWPVLGGVPLAYQSTEDVIVQAAVNFMPQVCSSFTPTALSDGALTGSFTGTAWFGWQHCFENWDKLAYDPTMFPIPSDIYNDLTSLLTAL